MAPAPPGPDARPTSAPSNAAWAVRLNPPLMPDSHGNSIAPDAVMADLASLAPDAARVVGNLPAVDHDALGVPRRMTNCSGSGLAAKRALAASCWR